MDSRFFTFVSICAYTLGFLFAILALWRSRTPQGTVAWVVGLISFPFVAIPAFLVFGRNRFNKYTRKRRKLDRRVHEVLESLHKTYELESRFVEHFQSFKAIAQSVRQPSFTSNNKIELLIDGERAYARLIEQIENAKSYILFQFYIFCDDKTGILFKDLLIKKSRQGVKIYFLYDDIATRLKRSFAKEMVSAGIKVAPFKSGKLLDSKIQVNFRNHRKNVVIDGFISFLGGLNIGDDYLGLNKSIGHWRDSHVMIKGPATISAQLSFLKDWNWAQNEVLQLNWEPQNSNGDSKVLVLHTGPADEEEAALLLHMTLINLAKRRIWISNPYFVPPEGLINCLALAAQRGVDVRVIIPARSDNRYVDAAAKLYVEKLLRYGIRFFRYNAGFIHQKVVLIDSDFGMVASTNFDSRSLFINFEIQAVSTEPTWVFDIEKMLTHDFTNCDEITIEIFDKQSILSQLFSRAANLISPML